MDWLNLIAALGTLGMGLLGLLAPRKVEGLVGLEAKNNVGRSEFRATYGGLWLALGLVPLLTGEPLAYAMAGLAWLCIALGRILSIMLDKAGDPNNWGGVVFEAVFGVALIAGAPFGWLSQALNLR